MTTQITNDFSRDVTDEIQALLDAPSRDVYLPGGTYKISRPLKIRSNTRLSLATDATIRLADGTCTSMLVCATRETCSEGNYDVTENIVIRGGCWDSNNVNMPPRPPRPIITAFQLGNIRNMLIEDLTIKDPGGFSIMLDGEYFTVQNIYFDHNLLSPNMDGVHVLAPSRFGHIRDIKGPTNDDMVALNAGEGARRGHITDISVDGVYAENCYTGVRLLSTYDSYVERVSLSNIYGSFRYNAVSITHHDLYPGTPIWFDHISISNVFAAKAGPELRRPNMYEEMDHWGREITPMIWFAIGVRCGHMTLSNIWRNERTDTSAELIRVDEDVQIERLHLTDITEKRLLRRETPMIYNAGEIEELRLDRVRSSDVRFVNEGNITKFVDCDRI